MSFGIGVWDGLGKLMHAFLNMLDDTKETILPLKFADGFIFVSKVVSW